MSTGPTPDQVNLLNYTIAKSELSVQPHRIFDPKPTRIGRDAQTKAEEVHIASHYFKINAVSNKQRVYSFKS